MFERLSYGLTFKALTMSTIEKDYEIGFYVTGGTLDRDAACYVVRQADQQLYDGLRRGQFCYLLTARQMGKSSLMVRTAARLREEGVGVAVLDLTALGQNLSAEQWYSGMLTQIGQQLELEDELEEFWESNRKLGPLQRWMQAVRRVALPRYTGPVTIFVDEIDAVRSLPFSTDEFFAAIREFYNRRTEDEELKRLTFCLLGVASPSDLIRDTRTTPFNIGRRIELYDFTGAEAAPLAQGLEREERVGAAMLKRILYWTGGHPYLTQRLCQAAMEDASVSGPDGIDRLCEELLFTSRAKEQDDNLLFVRERMLRSEVDLAGLLTLYVHAHRGKRLPDDETNPLVSVLRLSGITRVEGAYLKVRNRIYQRVFDRAWVMASMPDAEMRRQRAAYRRGLLRAAAVGAVILAIMGALSFAASRGRQQAVKQQQIAEQEKLKAERERHRADQNAVNSRKAFEDAQSQRKQAEEQRAEAVKHQQIAEEREKNNRHLVYDANLQLAWATTNNSDHITEYLANYLPRPYQEDLRGFEWYYLWRLAHRGLDLPIKSRVSSLAFSPDGKILAMGSFDGAAKLWDIDSGRLAATLAVDKDWVCSVAFSADGKTLATGGGDYTARLWDVATRRERATFRGHEGSVLSVAFSPDGKTLATGSRDQTAKLWDVATEQVLKTLSGHKDAVVAVAFSPDGETLVTGGGGISTRKDNTAILWDVTTGRRRADFEGHKGSVLSIAFSPDGETLATGSNDQTTRLWNVATRQNIAILTTDRSTMLKGGNSRPELVDGVPDDVFCLAFSPDGKILAIGGRRDELKLWDVANQELVTTLPGEGEAILSVAFSPRGRMLASADENNKVKLWDIADERKIVELNGQKDWKPSTFSSDGKTVALRSPDYKSIKLYGMEDGKELATFKEQTGRPLPSIALSPTNKFLAAAISSIALSPTSKFLAAAINDNSVRLWDVPARRELATLKGHAGSVHAAVFSPDSMILATGSSDRTVKLWNLSTHRPLATLEGHEELVLALTFSPDGRILATGSGQTVRLWNVSTGQILATKRYVRTIYSLAFSTDGKMLAVGGDDSVGLWDVFSPREITILKRGGGSINSMVFSPDGKRLAVGRSNKSVALWDLATKQEIATFWGHTSVVLSVIFSPNGKTLGSIGGNLKLWHGANDAEVTAQSK